MLPGPAGASVEHDVMTTPANTLTTHRARRNPPRDSFLNPTTAPPQKRLNQAAYRRIQGGQKSNICALRWVCGGRGSAGSGSLVASVI